MGTGDFKMDTVLEGVTISFENLKLKVLKYKWFIEISIQYQTISKYNTQHSL